MLTGGAAMVLLGASGCGYLLYPERRGRTGGRIDIPVLIIDLLWLIPGIIPGVICLIVDFTTGCIYESRMRASASETSQPPAATVTIDLDGAVVATGELQSDRRMHLSWKRAPDLATLRARGRMVVRAGDEAKAEVQVGELI
jgi:hypothetical protein